MLQVPSIHDILRDAGLLLRDYLKHAGAHELSDAHRLAQWSLMCGPWPLRDNFGGVDVPARLDGDGNPVPFPTVVRYWARDNAFPLPIVMKYWDSWSKMLFIKDGLMALFGGAMDHPVQQQLCELW